jgi:hypothetical protein
MISVSDPSDGQMGSDGSSEPISKENGRMLAPIIKTEAIKRPTQKASSKRYFPDMSDS